MATTPNPSTTEWVPLWDLNGTPVGQTNPHHVTHEPGGTDAIVGAAWLNQVNIFTQNQRITKIRPYWELSNPGSIPVARIGQHSSASRIDIMSNHSFNGTDIIADDTSLPSAQYSQLSGLHQFFTIPAGANPRTSALLEVFRIDTSGLITVPAGNVLITKIRPELQLQYTGDVSKTHIERHIPNAMVIGDNLSYDGSNWNRDNTAIAGSHIVMNTGTTQFRNITAPGVNPATLIDTLRIDATGVVTSAAGNIRVTSTRPMFEAQYPGVSTVARFGQVVPNERVDISSNLSHNGSNWNADDVSQGSALYIQQAGAHLFYTTAVTANPRPPSLVVNITASGTMVVPGGLGSTPLNASNITSGTIPDARLSSNVALLNVYNTFAPIQFFSGTQPELRMYAADQPANSRVWRIIDTGGLLYFQATDDPVSAQQGAVTISRIGVLTAGAGLGGTPLNATQLTSGTVPLARYQSSGWFYPVYSSSGAYSGQAYAFQQGYWTRTGNQVTVWAYLQLSVVGVFNGTMRVSGFSIPCGNPPGAPSGMQAPFVAGSISYYSNLGTPNDYVGLTCRMGATWNYVELFKLHPNANNPTNMVPSDFNGATQMILSITYFAD